MLACLAGRLGHGVQGSEASTVEGTGRWPVAGIQLVVTQTVAAGQGIGGVRLDGCHAVCWRGYRCRILIGFYFGWPASSNFGGVDGMGKFAVVCRPVRQGGGACGLHKHAPP